MADKFMGMKIDNGYTSARKQMPHVMALNSDKTAGPKRDPQPEPAVSKVVAFAKGGAVKKPAAKSDAKQDKAMMSRHNKLMHPGQKSKLAKGGKACMAKGGSVKKNWIKGAIKKPGALHKQLGVPEGKKIPAKKLNAAAKKGGKLGQRARLAKTLKGMKK